MSLPTPSDVHVNRPLNNVSIAYIQNQQSFVAGRAFPTVPSGLQSNIYPVVSRADFNRNEMQVRAPGTQAAGGGYRIDLTNTFFCPVRAYAHDIPDQVRANNDTSIDLDRAATLLATQKFLIAREVIFITNYMAASVWDFDYDGAASSPGSNEALQWNDSSSTPVEDVRSALTDVHGAGGFRPNKLIIGQGVEDALLDHADIVDRVKHSSSPGSPAVVNNQALAAIWGLDEVLTIKGVYNTAAEAATESSALIGEKDALLVYAAPTPSLLAPTAGYTFAWTGYTGAGPDGTRIKRFYMDAEAQWRVEIEAAFDLKVVDTALGFFWDGIVA